MAAWSIVATQVAYLRAAIDQTGIGADKTVGDLERAIHKTQLPFLDVPMAPRAAFWSLGVANSFTLLVLLGCVRSIKPITSQKTEGMFLLSASSIAAALGTGTLALAPLITSLGAADTILDHVGFTHDWSLIRAAMIGLSASSWAVTIMIWMQARAIRRSVDPTRSPPMVHPRRSWDKKVRPTQRTG